ncbi:MAG: tetratricopeptide repeat protein [Xanthomonadaceae bacterium]|nr:tetratricopeptide repeat protein [Xanthomonadaceae bacterium]
MSADDKRQALEQLHKGAALHRAGQLGLAQSHYQRAAKLDPQNADAWHLLGVAALQGGNPALAAKHLRTCVQVRPGFAEAHNNLGVALRQNGKHAEAVAAFRQALAVRNGYIDAMFNLGIAYEAAGQPAEADRCYRQVLGWRADHADAAANLGNLLRRHGQLNEALPFAEMAQRVAPDRAQTNGNLALLLSDLGRQADAVRCAREAIAREPDQALWWKTLGVAQRLLHDIDNAVPSLRRALELDPGDAATALEFALALNEGGEYEAACKLYATTAPPPGFGERVRWLRALNLPAIYRDEAEIDAARARFDTGLHELESGLRLDSPSAIHEAVHAAASVAPFHLHYQPRDNTGLQARFGDLVARVMSAAAPELAAPCDWVPRAHGGRVRVGIVASHLMQHTVSRYFARLIEGLDRERFDVTVWHGGIEDDSTRRIAAGVSRFVQTQAGALNLARVVRDARLDVLVYPEIGMDPRHQALAGLRLAPVQCALYGHPATSGAPAIDYFLSGAELEPPDADKHYRERLLRLPGLGTQPLPPPAPGDGAWFDAVAGRAPLVLCLQNFIKLIPAFDATLARIAAATGARIGFFTRNPPLMRVFRARIETAFAARKLDPARHLVFLPVQTHADYLAGIARAPLVLDSPWFSGGGTSLDAFRVDTPVLAWEGAMARGRQTSAMLRIMDIAELIATSEDDYVAKAIALVRDVDRRDALRRYIARRQDALFEDGAVVKAFAQFLAGAQTLV